MATTTRAVNAQELSDGDWDVVVRLVEELHDAGRMNEAAAVYRLVLAADRAGLRPGLSLDDLTPEDIASLEAGEQALAEGKIIPWEIGQQGPAAVEEFKRRRDAGDVDPETAEAIANARRMMRELRERRAEDA